MRDNDFIVGVADDMSIRENLLQIKKHLPKSELSLYEDVERHIKMQDIEIHQLRNDLTKWYLGQTFPVKQTNKCKKNNNDN